MIPRTEAELSAQLRALAVDPPDDGFAQRLSERLQQCGPGSEPRAQVVRFAGRPIRANQRMVVLLAAAAVLVAGGAAAVAGPATVTRWIARWTGDETLVPEAQPKQQPSTRTPRQAGPVKGRPQPVPVVQVPRVEVPALPASSETNAAGAAPPSQQGSRPRLASPAVAAAPTATQRALAGSAHRKAPEKLRRRVDAPQRVGVATPRSRDSNLAQRLHVPRVHLVTPDREPVASGSRAPARTTEQVRRTRPGPASARVEPATESSSRPLREARKLREERLQRRERRRQQRQLRRRQRRRTRPAPRAPR